MNALILHIPHHRCADSAKNGTGIPHKTVRISGQIGVNSYLVL